MKVHCSRVGYSLSLESSPLDSRGLDVLAPVQEVDVSTTESSPTTGGHAGPVDRLTPILYAEDLERRSPVGLESPSMPILEQY